MKVYVCYDNSDDQDNVTEISFQPIDHPQLEFLTKDLSPRYSIRAETWEEAMQAHHAIQGWEPYEPVP